MLRSLLETFELACQSTKRHKDCGVKTTKAREMEGGE